MNTRTEDHLRALRYAQRCFERWAETGKVAADQYQSIRRYYEKRTDEATVGAPPCEHLRPPGEEETRGSLVEEWRYLYFLGGEVQKHVEANRLGVHAGHAARSRIAARIRAIQGELDEKPTTAPATAGRATPEAKPGPRPTVASEKVRKPPAAERNLLEVLLEPRSIQYLMVFGGALLVLGLVVWLVAEGIFHNPLIVAIALGTANLAVLGGGAALIRWTRYRTAGRGVALLACLVMPLNLWFYSSQGLVTLEGGGHLWVPALVCCVLYAVTARLVRDPAFVYILVGGVTLTGLLILADQDVGRFWEIIAPSAMLVVIGLASIHVERAFPEGDGPFRRERFGRAFFYAGHCALGAGLLLLLGGRIAGWLYDPLFAPWHAFEEPAIMTSRSLQLIAFCLVTAATYAYIYSDLTVQRHHAFAYVAVFTLLWGEILLVDLLPIPLTEEMVVFLLAMTALVVNIAQGVLVGSSDKGPEAQDGRFASRLAGVASSLGLLLATVPVALGILMYLRATFGLLHARWPHELGWQYAAVMLVAAAACRMGAHVFRKTSNELTSIYFFGAAAATLLSAVGILALLGQETWEATAPWLMLIPIGYVVAARFYDANVATPLRRAAHVATGLMIAFVIGASLQPAGPWRLEVVSGARTNLLLALFFAEATAFYAVVARQSKHGVSVYLAAACACGALWQLLDFVQVAEAWYILTFAAAGLATLVAYRLAVIDRVTNTAVSLAAFRCGNTLLMLAGTAGVLYSLNRFPDQSVDLSLLGLLGPLMVTSIVATMLVSEDGWRRSYLVLAVVQALVAFLAFTVASHLSVGQKFELFSLVAGTILLVIGYLGWYRERDAHDNTVTLALTLGAILTAGPMVFGLISQRFTVEAGFRGWGLLHEIGGLAVGLALLGSGVLCRIRSTTIAGGGLLAIYLLTLLCFIPVPEQLKHTAVYIMVGGGLLFASAVLLSIYRDRLLALPEQIRTGQGVFKVLRWR